MNKNLKNMQMQMLDYNPDSDWWRKIIQYFLKPGDEIEIHCWLEEKDEIKQALSYGSLIQSENKYQRVIKGVLTEQKIKELSVLPEPADKRAYNKMTVFFTIIAGNRVFSEHYGTELYILNVNDSEENFLREIIKPYRESFSMGMV